jgi:hypothetical protein
MIKETVADAHMERARIVLFAAAGQQEKEIAAVIAVTPKKDVLASLSAYSAI